ncbi:MAG: dihydropteroate synthase [Bryobacteraceae bacterium]
MTLVGERANLSGSRAFDRLVTAGDWDAAVDFALAQTSEGAAILDVCLISETRDEVRDTEQFYSRAALRNHRRWMVDSQHPLVMERALQVCGEGQVLNSASLANPANLDRVGELALQYGAAIVVACRDAAGPAMTRHAKLDAARRALDQLSIETDKVILDLLAFPITAFPDALAETLDAIGLIRQACPGARTLLALSNFSFRMPFAERFALEERILNEACAAGLDFLILNTRRHRGARCL